MRSPTAAYNAERNRRELSGDLYPGPQNPVISLPDPDEPDTCECYRQMALRVREMYATGHAERCIGEAKAQRLAAELADCWEWLDNVGPPKDLGASDPDPNWDRFDEDDEPHTDRHLWGI